MSSIEEARKSLLKLNKLMPSGEKNIIKVSKTKEKTGVIFVLTSSSGNNYIGFEFEHNIEWLLKDLIVRYLAFKELGTLYDASYHILDDGPVLYRPLNKIVVNTKYELAQNAEDYIIELGEDNCVNIWSPEDLLRKVEKPRVIYSRNVIKDIERYSKDIEKTMLKEYLNKGYSKEDAKNELKEFIRNKYDEYREIKHELYNKIYKIDLE